MKANRLSRLVRVGIGLTRGVRAGMALMRPPALLL